MAAGGSSHVMGGACLAPAVAELPCPAGKAGAHVGVTKGEDGARLVDALGHHELEVTVLVLRDAQIGHGAKVRIELGQIAAAGLAVEHRHDLHGGLLLGNVGIAGTGMADDADILVKVDGVHLTQLAAACNGLEDGHGHSHLDVTLHGTGNALLDKHGEGRDQHAVQHTGLALGKTIVMRRDEGDLLVLDPLLKGDDILCHLPDLFHRAAAFDIEGIQDILCLGTDGSFVGDVVGDGHIFSQSNCLVYSHIRL